MADPLNQRVLDPACGSGAFIAAAVKHFVEASKQDSTTNPRETLDHHPPRVTEVATRLRRRESCRDCRDQATGRRPIEQEKP